MAECHDAFMHTRDSWPTSHGACARMQAGDNDGSFFTRPMTDEELQEQEERIARRP